MIRGKDIEDINEKHRKIMKLQIVKVYSYLGVHIDDKGSMISHLQHLKMKITYLQ
jgi:hypothetical protein